MQMTRRDFAVMAGVAAMTGPAFACHSRHTRPAQKSTFVCRCSNSDLSTRL
jgi:hypothetical protein